MTCAPEVFDVARAGTDRKQVFVEMSLTSLEPLDVTLCNNLMVRSMGPKSKALYALIVGDQIIDINGRVPNSPADAIRMIRSEQNIKFLVSRVSNRTPVSIDRVMSTSLKRLDGYCYFVVTLQKTAACSYLGLGIKSFRGKVTVDRVDQNSIASHAYMVGDSILDINGERVHDVELLRKRLGEYLSKWGVCSTIVERPESTAALQTARAKMFLFMPRMGEPQMGDDAVAIGQREMMKYRANVNKQRHIKSALRKKSSQASRKSKEDEKLSSKSGDSSSSVVRNIFHIESSGRSKRKKAVKFTGKNAEVTIESDVQNPNLLQKVKRHGYLRSFGITMLPSMFFSNPKTVTNANANNSGGTSQKKGTSVPLGVKP
ncbi:hypothetical protein QR680_010397 [Steinernema hermaphroditum]|uniref:PDZ domain-containing protein n=1 Tax=Steinernema hermaphroditum TaxID=289476 RepID=A0AA39INT8_9BILA|nr:hypothetical protein QR680_010397 [Steinernema hermaphroditum]